ncbi:MAG: hypothetical protein IPG74_14365 [Flavobacteriales bacterium]|nr:hypothetical protein [Flavobacteriales bacterium]
MYPYKNVVALSDNLLGTAPMYSLFRNLGSAVSRPTNWILALFSLNYICCFIALFLWSKRSTLAACGAFVFAFGIYMIGHLEHAQVFPEIHGTDGVLVVLAMARFRACQAHALHGARGGVPILLRHLSRLPALLCTGLPWCIGYGVVNFRQRRGFQPGHWR